MAGESTVIRWTCAAKSGTMGAEIHKRERTTDHDIYFRAGQQAAEKAQRRARRPAGQGKPQHDYTDTQKKLAELEQRIRKVKHAINMFNATHVIPDFNMTIDEMLVYIPQLTQRKNKLADMKARLPKQRVEEQYGRQSNIIDYSYANYDLTAVEADYEKVSDELSRAQLALDAVNQRDTFELAE